MEPHHQTQFYYHIQVSVNLNINYKLYITDFDMQKKKKKTFFRSCFLIGSNKNITYDTGINSSYTFAY